MPRRALARVALGRVVRCRRAQAATRAGACLASARARDGLPGAVELRPVAGGVGACLPSVLDAIEAELTARGLADTPATIGTTGCPNDCTLFFRAGM